MRKDLALRMLKVIEEMYLENMIMKDQLKRKGWHAIDKVLAEAKADDKMMRLVQKQFVSVRQEIEKDGTLEDAVEALLRIKSPSGQVN